MLKKTVIIIILFLSASAGIPFYMNKPPAFMKDTVFTVREGESLRDTSLRLKRDNLVKSREFILLAGWFKGDAGCKSGRYRIRSGMSSSEIIDLLYRGKVISAKVTIPEGYNIYEIAAKLDSEDITSKREFLKSATDRAFLKSTGIDSASAEGYIFPDTYVFSENSDARDVIKIMHRRFRDVIREIGFISGKKNGLTLPEYVKLASLIEEEAAVSGERKYISSVFHNRIRKGMRFDCDPTVRYALKKFSGKLYLSDLKVDSPYNTYIYKGFPPTPICSPGRESLTAALYPAESDFLFFVARNDRSHFFSVTLKEHLAAVDRYIRGRNNGFIDSQRLN